MREDLPSAPLSSSWDIHLLLRTDPRLPALLGSSSGMELIWGPVSPLSSEPIPYEARSPLRLHSLLPLEPLADPQAMQQAPR